MRSLMSVSLAFAIAACGVAPQHPGWQRSSFIGLTTANGAFGGMLAGAIVGGIPCWITLSHKCPSPYDYGIYTGALLGGLVGGYFAYASAADATSAPNTNEWVLTATPGVLVLGGAALAIIWKAGRATKEAVTGAPRGDRFVAIYTLEVTSSDAAKRTISLAGRGCEVSMVQFQAIPERNVVEGPADTAELPLCTATPTADGKWRVALRVVSAAQ